MWYGSPFDISPKIVYLVLSIKTSYLCAEKEGDSLEATFFYCTVLFRQTNVLIWPVVVAQLAERYLQIQDVSSSIPVIGKILYRKYFLYKLLKTRKYLRGKENGNGLLNKYLFKQFFLSRRFEYRHRETNTVLIGERNS